MFKILELDECEFNKHQCEHICVNRIGGYECDCFSGYSLKSDGYTCESKYYNYIV